VITIFWIALCFLVSVLLLSGAIRDTGETAELRILIGAVLFVVPFYMALFTLKRYMLAKKLQRHVNGK
jgi:hypothetical protein